jgi:hypothetical protein
MKLHFFFATMTIFLASLALEARAWAQHERPVIVAYEAPPECASAEAFQVLLATEIARSHNPDRPWRFSVVIRRRPDSYAGTLTTESGVRTVTATRCDDVAEALALIVAMAEPAPEAPPPPPPAPAAPGPVEVAPAPRAVDASRAGVAADPSVKRLPLEWRIGARGLATNHGLASATLGGLGFLSVELPWGFRKMLFEVGAGAFTNFPVNGGWAPTGTFVPATSAAWLSTSITYLVLDTQSCLLDVPIAQTGLSVLGCLRLAGASFRTLPSGLDASSGGALWVGAGARLRWQAQFGLFLEANVDAVYGTVSAGESNSPGWFDAGASVGFRL